MFFANVRCSKQLLLLFMTVFFLNGCSSAPSTDDIKKVLIDFLQQFSRSKLSMDHIEIVKPLPKDSKTGFLVVSYRVKAEESLYSPVKSEHYPYKLIVK